MKVFNDLADFTVGEIEALIGLANRLDKNPEPQALSGKVLALLFLNPSLRTLASFQAAMTRLGGGTFVISPDMSIHGLESRSGIIMDGTAAEHIREAVPVIASYADAIGIRASAQRESLQDDLRDKKYNELISLIDKPHINMESSIHHPCQGLGDWKTMDDHNIPGQGGKVVIAWTNHPQPLPYAVPATTLEVCVRRGMEVTLLRPEGFELPEELLGKARALGESQGASIRETVDRKDAMQDASVLYASSWSSQKFYDNTHQEDRFKRDLIFSDWCTNNSWFENARDDCRFMHCLPVRRGVAVEDEVLDSARSIVISEAKNRMLVQMAVLHEILTVK